MEEAVRMVKWISPEDDFETLFKNGEYEKIVRLSEENEELLYNLYQRKENDNLGKSIKFGLFLMKYFKRLFVEEIRSLAVWNVGKLMGYLELLARLQYSSEQDRLVSCNAKYSGTKHLDEIIFALEIRGNVTQTELSEILKLQPSTLSEVLKKVRRTGFVQATPYGKYKMYSLTEEGIRYGALLRKKKGAEPEYLKAIEVLNKYIEDKNTRDECLKCLKMSLNTQERRLIGRGDEITIVDAESGQYEKGTIRHILSKQSNSQKQPQNIVIAQKYSGLKDDGLDDNDLGQLEA